MAGEFNGALTSGNFTFARRTVRENTQVDLYLFCDTSKDLYGFAIYALQESCSHLLFSKFWLAPKPNKTLPTLELLAKCLASQCCVNILKGKNLN